MAQSGSLLPSRIQVSHIRANLEVVEGRIGDACRRAGRQRHEVQLVAVSKGQPAEAIREAYAAGQRIFGENYAQELVHKCSELQDLPLEFHFIGALQRNKVKDVIVHISLLHTVDRASLVAAIDAKATRKVDVLLQVNVSDEQTKSGCSVDQAAQLALTVRTSKWLTARGIMAIPAPTQPEQMRKTFAGLRKLRDDLVSAGLTESALSMGMSTDYEVAIEEGATLIRVGTAIFGSRENRA